MLFRMGWDKINLLPSFSRSGGRSNRDPSLEEGESVYRHGSMRVRFGSWFNIDGLRWFQFGSLLLNVLIETIFRRTSIACFRVYSRAVPFFS